jgi:dynein heavy chain
MPSQDSLFSIYMQILNQHLNESRLKFSPPVQKIGENIVKASLSLHQRVSSSFLPTAMKFHYIFNLRDLSNLFQV